MATRGRPAFQPTDEQRKNVEVMASLGIPEEKICLLVRDRRDKPICRNSLRLSREAVWGKFAPDSLLEEAVTSELVSERPIPCSWENTGNFIDSGLGCPNYRSKLR